MIEGSIKECLGGSDQIDHPNHPRRYKFDLLELICCISVCPYRMSWDLGICSRYLAKEIVSQCSSLLENPSLVWFDWLFILGHIPEHYLLHQSRLWQWRPLAVGNLIKFPIKSGFRELIIQPLTIAFSILHLLYVGSVSIGCLILPVINPSLFLSEMNISMICDHSSYFWPLSLILGTTIGRLGFWVKLVWVLVLKFMVVIWAWFGGFGYAIVLGYLWFEKGLELDQ